MPRTPTFATDPGTADYYERRAAEYDEWYTGDGLFAGRERPGWPDDVVALEQFVGGLPPARTLDVACGTGFLTRHLRGPVVGLDRSPSMVAIARGRLPEGSAVLGDALHLPVADATFDRVVTGHFYGHFPVEERTAFVAEARRVAGELLVVDAARRPGTEPASWQERTLRDGSRHQIYKRYFTAEQLAEEVAGDVVLDREWFVGARVVW